MDKLNKKLKAFFHDPIDKAFNIQSHKNKAVEYYNLVGINENLFDSDVENSDRIASAADRINFSTGVSVDFNKEAELSHPLGSGNIKLAGDEYGYVAPKYCELERVITETITKIKNESKDEKTFLINLWRNIPDIFKTFEYEKFKLGNLWNLLPADTRIPDHSILDHNWLTSAINGSLPNPAFLKFSIGPVQSFIITAKRTEDYWAGSYILSYLSSKAIEVIVDEVGPEHIIFPYIKGQPLVDKFLKEKYSVQCNLTDSIKIPSLPNIIFAILPYEKSKDIAIKMKGNVEESFKTLADSIKNQFFDDKKINEIWNQQINDFVEVYYTIYKWPGKVEDLKNQYQQIFGNEPSVTIGKYSDNIGNFWQSMYKILDSYFNARKNIRNFNQLKSKDELTKCSLCGEREVLHPENINSTSELTEFWKKIGEKERKNGTYKIDINGRDKLCAVCFTKRMAGEYYFTGKYFNDPINYPSTSTIAALPFKLKVVKEWQKTFQIVKNYNELLKQLGIPKNFNWNLIRYIPVKVMYGESSFQSESNGFREFADFLSFDGQWIYEESFTKKFLIDNGILEETDYDSKKGIIDGIKKAISNISELIEDKPSKYFAVLVMDGDNMGKWISGTHKEWPLWKDVLHSKCVDILDEDIKNKKRNLSPSIHSFISKCLNHFSLELAKDIIEFEHPGKLVYSGGDDVLAFLPVDDVLNAAEKLRFTFSGNLNEDGKIDLTHTNGYILIKDKDGNKKIIPTLGNNATMSAGIVIAHKDHNLTEVLTQARIAEKEAKEDIREKGYGRDAFVIKILKHSGSITEYGAKWRKDNERFIEKIDFILQKVAKKENGEGLSMSFFQSMYDNIKKISATDLIKSILKLQLRRHVHLKQKSDETKQQYNERKNKYITDLEKPFNYIIDNSINDDSFKNLLLVLRFLVDGGKR